MRGRRMYVSGGLLGALVAPPAALAWPVDQALTLEPGQEKFQKLAAVDWAESDAPGVVTAEALSQSGELLLTPHAAGFARVLRLPWLPVLVGAIPLLETTIEVLAGCRTA